MIQSTGVYGFLIAAMLVVGSANGQTSAPTDREALLFLYVSHAGLIVDDEQAILATRDICSGHGQPVNGLQDALRRKQHLYANAHTIFTKPFVVSVLGTSDAPLPLFRERSVQDLIETLSGRAAVAYQEQKTHLESMNQGDLRDFCAVEQSRAGSTAGGLSPIECFYDTMDMHNPLRYSQEQVQNPPRRSPCR